MIEKTKINTVDVFYMAIWCTLRHIKIILEKCN